MTLYLESEGGFSAWHGEVIGDIRYPLNIEELWPPADLVAVGLYLPVDPGVPDGKISTGSRVERVGGIVTIIYDLIDAPAPDLQPYQFFAMLDLSGKKAVLDAYINALPMPANVIARSKLEHTLVFHRENDLVLAAQSALGLTDQQLDALWNQAAAIK